MKLLLTSLTSFILLITSIEVYAGAKDYDGTWTATVSCGAHKFNTMPSFTYEQTWPIENGVIEYKTTRNVEKGNETTWSGKVENSKASLKGVAILLKNSKELWSFSLNGNAINEGLISLSGGMYSETTISHSLLRDCTVTLRSLQPSEQSLAYIKAQPSTALTSNIPPKDSTPVSAVTGGKKLDKEAQISKPIATQIIKNDEKDLPSITSIPVHDKSREMTTAAPITKDKIDALTNGNYLSFILGGIISILVTLIAFLLRRNKKYAIKSVDEKKIKDLENKIANQAFLNSQSGDIENTLKLKVTQLEKKLVEINANYAAELNNKNSEFLSLKNEFLEMSIKLNQVNNLENQLKQSIESENKLRIQIAQFEKTIGDLNSQHLRELSGKETELTELRNQYANKDLELIQSKLGDKDIGSEPATPESPAVEGAAFVKKDTQPNLSQIFCTNCGTKNDSDAIFCIECGKKM